MDVAIFVGLLIFVLAVGTTVYIVWYRNALTRRGDELAPQWEGVARDLGLGYTRPSPAAGLIDGTWRDRRLHATVIRRRRGRGSVMFTRVMCWFSTRLPLEVRIAPALWPRPGERIRTGDASFDKVFDVTGHNPDLIALVLDASTRKAISGFHDTVGLTVATEAAIQSEWKAYGVDGATLARCFRAQVELSETLESAFRRAGSGQAADAFR